MPGEKVVAVVRLITFWGGSVTGKVQRYFRVTRKKSLIYQTLFQT